MNAYAPGNGAQHVGSAIGGYADAAGLTPIILPVADIKQAAVEAREDNTPEHVLEGLSLENMTKLRDYLKGRLDNGGQVRDRRLRRYARIDRLISTWQKFSPEDSERERIEDNTGKQTALPFNLPVLASHLNDMTSYYTEALAPISNPFWSSSGDQKFTNVLEKFNRDAQARDYYAELASSVRGLMKYNIGGFHTYWMGGAKGSATSKKTAYGSQPGNCWKALNMYNTLWDPAVRNPKEVSSKAEWAATVGLENRLELVRKSLAGEWCGLEDLLANNAYANVPLRARYYKEAAVEATLNEEGQDGRSTTADSANTMNWGNYGLGVASDLGPEVAGFEIVDMYCWLVPNQFGLLNTKEKADIDVNYPGGSKVYLELWRFKIVNGEIVADARPAVDRSASLGDKIDIPIYLTFLTQDELKECQRSFMELMRGFQRFASNMYNIFIAGMRKKVWGITAYDPTMFDVSGLPEGEVVGRIKSKSPGRDVRTGIAGLDVSSGVEQSLGAVDSALTIADKFFPTQSMPNQVAGIDRAVKSQVAMVVQGATRSLRMSLRILDSSLLAPSRQSAFRNLKMYDSEGIENITDEEIAKLLGSGIESMEAERVAEYLWQLLYAIIQNQEAMTVFDIAPILDYLSKVGNLSVSLGQFVRQQPTGPTPGTEGAPTAEAPPPVA